MVTLSDVAASHLRARAALADRATTRVLRLWQQVDINRLDASWDSLGPQIAGQVASAQVAAAGQADDYLSRVAPSSTPLRVMPEAFAGVDVYGNELAPALFGAVTTTKSLIGAGRTPVEAFQAGAVFLSLVANSAILDMGRQADLTGGVARKRTAYVRVVQPGACSRCGILAGKRSARTAFLRHPRCRCQAVPVGADEVTPDGFFGSPADYFDSMSASEQDRVFTKAGAEAIRQGADPMKVVNARRGAYGIGYSGHYNPPSVTRSVLRPVTIGVKPDGSPLRVFATTEGTTARGAFGRREIALTGEWSKAGRYRRSTSIRLMPEQIAVMANGNQTRWVELLERYGYLT